MLLLYCNPIDDVAVNYSPLPTMADGRYKRIFVTHSTMDVTRYCWRLRRRRSLFSVLIPSLVCFFCFCLCRVYHMISFNSSTAFVCLWRSRCVVTVVLYRSKSVFFRHAVPNLVDARYCCRLSNGETIPSLNNKKFSFYITISLIFYEESRLLT